MSYGALIWELAVELVTVVVEADHLLPGERHERVVPRLLRVRRLVRPVDEAEGAEEEGPPAVAFSGERTGALFLTPPHLQRRVHEALERPVEAVAAELRLHVLVAGARLRADARYLATSGLLQDLHASLLLPLALGLRAGRLAHFGGEAGLVRLHHEADEPVVPVLAELLSERPDVLLAQRVVRAAEVHRLDGAHFPLLHQGLPVLADQPSRNALEHGLRRTSVRVPLERVPVHPLEWLLLRRATVVPVHAVRSYADFVSTLL